MNYEQIIKQIETPCYLFDISVLKERIQYLSEIFESCDLVYALKANPFIAKEIDPFITRYELCSYGEFEICNNLNINRNKMVISGVYKNASQIDHMIRTYPDILKYTIESVNQYEMLKEIALKYKQTIHLLIRLTSGNQFGVTKEEAEKIIAEANPQIIIDGIEYYSGTQKKSLGLINKEINKLNDFIYEVKDKYNFVIPEVEYGPGLPVSYFMEDTFDEESYLHELNELIHQISASKVTLEIGRSIAASMGSYITKVVDQKSNKNGNFVIVDGGINHITYYGQTLGMHLPYHELLPYREGEIETYNIYGSLCTVNDVIVKSLKARTIKINDILIFKNTGAYSMTEGISLFLSRDLPNIYLKNLDGQIIKVRENLKTSTINFPNYVRSDLNGKIN